MSFWNKLKESGKSVRDSLSDEVKRYKNKDFMEASTAICAWVAAADGQIDTEEKQKMIGFIKQSNELSVFNQDDVIASFNSYAGKFEFDSSIGKGEAVKAISKLAKDPGAARLLIQVGVAIGASDGDFDAEEKAVCREACVALNLNPEEFDF
jgi:tellurite resistance protein TerB